MPHSLRRLLLVFLLLVLAAILASCATRHYVKHEVAPIQSQVDVMQDAQMEQNANIDRADRAARTAMDLADRAAMAVMAVNEMAGAAARKAADAERRADTAQVSAMRALNGIDTAQGLIENQIANLDKYSVAEQKTITFKFDSDALSKEAVSRLDDLAGTITTSSTGYLIEIQGYTDSVGPEKYNLWLSERRAAAVLRYLVSRGVRLHRISIVGFGKENPVAENTTVKGREENRRVEVRILRSGMLATARR